MGKEITFVLYRYQLLPKDILEVTFFDNIKSIDDLIGRKNDILQDILLSLDNQKFSFRGSPIKFQLKHNDDDYFLFKLGIKRITKIGNENLEDTEQDDWKNIFVIFWNHPDKQFLIIQHKTDTFKDIAIANKCIIQTIQELLLQKCLIIKSESLFNKVDFWNIIHKYPNRISKVSFQFITPNMSNISKSLTENLKSLAKTTNTAESFLDIVASESTALHIKDDNELVGGIVDYASNGGGSITIVIKGIRKHFRTTDNNKSISIDEVIINGGTKEDMQMCIERIKQLLDF